MSTTVLLDAAGRPRSPAMLPGHHACPSPGNKGLRYPADPPTVEEIVAVMRQAGAKIDGRRTRASRSWSSSASSATEAYDTRGA